MYVKQPMFLFTDVSEQPIRSIFNGHAIRKINWRLRTVSDSFLETRVINYQHKLRNVPEEQSPKHHQFSAFRPRQAKKRDQVIVWGHR